MIRLSGIPNAFKRVQFVDISVNTTEFDESIADKSYFHPSSEIARIASSVPSGAPVSETAYMFPDGVDSGIDMPIALRKGVDLAELSQAQQNMERQLKESLEEAGKDYRRAQRILDREKQQQQQQSNNVEIPKQ